jgi:hypothetical protein
MSDRRRSPEAAIQRAVVDHLRLRARPDVLWLHCPNGEHRNPITGAKLKQPASGVSTRSGKLRFFTLGDLDQRTAAYRMTLELIENVEGDLGGADQLSTAERQIIRHAALTGTMLEDLGTRWLNGEKVDPALFATLSNSERRLYETVGLRRRPRDVTPDLRTYLAEPAP